MKKSELKALKKELNEVSIRLAHIFSKFEVEKRDKTTNVVNFMKSAMNNIQYAIQDAETEIERLKEVDEANKLNWHK